jgi:hypothetical protein
MIWLRVRDEGAELPDPATGEPTLYAGGAIISTPDERRSEELLGTGLVTPIDASFIAVRVHPDCHVPGVDLSNDRILGVRENVLFPYIGTDADRILTNLAGLHSASPMSEDEFRQMLRDDPECSVYAEAEFPALPFYIGLEEAVALVSNGHAAPLWPENL